jgi:hypothetical protein
MRGPRVGTFKVLRLQGKGRLLWQRRRAAACAAALRRGAHAACHCPWCHSRHCAATTSTTSPRDKHLMSASICASSASSASLRRTWAGRDPGGGGGGGGVVGPAPPGRAGGRGEGRVGSEAATGAQPAQRHAHTLARRVGAGPHPLPPHLRLHVQDKPYLEVRRVDRAPLGLEVCQQLGALSRVHRDSAAAAAALLACGRKVSRQSGPAAVGTSGEVPAPPGLARQGLAGWWESPRHESCQCCSLPPGLGPGPAPALPPPPCPVASPTHLLLAHAQEGLDL